MQLKFESWNLNLYLFKDSLLLQKERKENFKAKALDEGVKFCNICDMLV